MQNNNVMLRLEFGGEAEQEELWTLEDELRKIEGVRPDLREPQSGIVEMIPMFVHVALPYISAGAGITTIALNIYRFLYPDNKLARTVVITDADGTKTELSGLTEKQIDAAIRRTLTTK